VREVTKKEFADNFISDRFNEIKKYAEVVRARKKITVDDLISLGYMK
jgi:hypothetical protein